MSQEMTDTVTNKKYERIEWTDIRDGDVLLHKNGDRLTVSVVDHVGDPTCKAAGAWRSVSSMTDDGFTPYRKQPELPNEPGHYLDAEGYHWKLTSNANRPWYRPGSDDHFTTEEVQDDAPFTRLVPMPTEEQIREMLFKTDPGTIYGVDAVVDGMKSLLGGGDDE